MLEFFIAMKYIKKRKFQSIASVMAIFISLTVFIVSLVISDGLKTNMVNSILTVSPHITVITDKDNYRDVKDKILTFEGVKSISDNVEMKGFIRHKGEDIIPAIYATDISNINIKLIEKIEYDKINYAYVGQSFLEEHNMKIGDYISLVSLEGKEMQLILRASFKTGFLSYDKNFVIIPKEIAQILLENGDKISSLQIRVDEASNIKKINFLKNQINNIDESIFSYSWADENYNLLSAVEFENFILILILSMLFLISSFVVVVILNISVREKTRDIGVLKAMGYTKKSIQNIFIIQASILGSVGIALSAIISPIVLKIIQIISRGYLSKTYYISQLIIKINIKEALLVYLFAIIVIYLSSLLPAKKAANLDPVEAIKFNL